MSGESSQVRDDSMLEEGEIRSPGIAAVANVLLEMNSNGDDNREIGNRNHKPMTDGADGAGQGVEGRLPTPMEQVQSAGGNWYTSSSCGQPTVIAGGTNCKHQCFIVGGFSKKFSRTRIGARSGAGSRKGSESQCIDAGFPLPEG